MYQPHMKMFQQRPASDINIGQTERTISLIGGVALTTGAIVLRRTISIPMMLVGLLLAYRGATGNDRVYRLLGINTAVTTNPSRVSVPHQQGIHVVSAVTVDRPVEDLYNFWRDPTNLSLVLKNVDSMQILGGSNARWTIRLPGGMNADLDMELNTDVPNEVISWRSTADSQIDNAWSVRFRPAPTGRGTEVEMTVEFVPPGGPLGKAVLNLFNDAPAQYIGQFLREFKQMMEPSEVATASGQSSGHESETRNLR